MVGGTGKCRLFLSGKISGGGRRRSKTFAGADSCLHALIDGKDPFRLFENLQQSRSRHDYDARVIADHQIACRHLNSADRYRPPSDWSFSLRLPVVGTTHRLASHSFVARISSTSRQPPSMMTPLAPRLLTAREARPPRVEIGAPPTSTINTLPGPVASTSRPTAKSDFSKSPKRPDNCRAVTAKPHIRPLPLRCGMPYKTPSIHNSSSALDQLLTAMAAQRSRSPDSLVSIVS